MRNPLLAALLAATAATIAAQQPAQPVNLGVPPSQSHPVDESGLRKVLTGQAAFTDWNQQSPGVRHKITVADLPEPKPEEAVNNTPHLVPKPADAWPIAPAGFKVSLYAGGDAKPMQRADNVQFMRLSGGTFTEPRLLRTAPNGDLFVADSGAGKIIVLRGTNPDGKATTIETFASGLDHPFGISFYPAANPKFVYIGTATAVVRLPYKSGDLHATGAPETIVPDIPGYAQLTGGGHWTRDVVFNKEGKMLVSVGSASNATDPDTDFQRDGSGRQPREFHRADILAYTPEGKFLEVYAHGIRNCVGEAISPVTGTLWCSVNERDDLGNHLVPDYVTSVPEGSFFGWPWYYMGGHKDPRLPDPCANGTGPNLQAAALTADAAKNCKRVDLSKQVRTPDVLVQPHMASLQMTFYPSAMNGFQPGIFPRPFMGGIFAAEHGSWNRANRAGYEVIFIPTVNGKATGEYDDFLTGFVTKDGQVWGRPVGVTVANDGSLFVTDDGSRSIWHITYTGK
jgi:glucose/arabinose dehydrogenase